MKLADKLRMPAMVFYEYRVDDGALYREAADAMEAALDALEMVRDADNDCRADGLPTMPEMPRAKIERAIAKLKGE